jgi:hypothetical protein
MAKTIAGSPARRSSLRTCPTSRRTPESTSLRQIGGAFRRVYAIRKTHSGPWMSRWAGSRVGRGTGAFFPGPRAGGGSCWARGSRRCWRGRHRRSPALPEPGQNRARRTTEEKAASPPCRRAACWLRRPGGRGPGRGRARRRARVAPAWVMTGTAVTGAAAGLMGGAGTSSDSACGEVGFRARGTRSGVLQPLLEIARLRLLLSEPLESADGRGILWLPDRKGPRSATRQVDLDVFRRRRLPPFGG